MGNQTTVGTVTLAAGSATIALWLLGYFQPELMDAAPVGLEAAITGVFAAVVGYIKDSAQ